MLISFESLQELPQETLNNLIREYLLTQVEDLNFERLDISSIDEAILRCKQALKSGTLLVEYGEQDQSIAIKHKDGISMLK